MFFVLIRNLFTEWVAGDVIMASPQKLKVLKRVCLPQSGASANTSTK
jgi:hypothetical protein